MAAVFADAVARLRAAIPAIWSETALDIPLPRGVFETLWVTGRGFGFADIIAARAAEMDPGLVRCAELARGYSTADLLGAIDGQRRHNAALAAQLEASDVLVTPTMPLTAFAAGDEVPPGGEADAPLPWVSWTPYTYPFNLSGQPAVSIPCGFDPDGLPVGLQVVAGWGADRLALAVGAALRAGARPRPPGAAQCAMKTGISARVSTCWVTPPRMSWRSRLRENAPITSRSAPIALASASSTSPIER